MSLTTMKACLKIMSSVVAYSNMSPEALPDFVRALCLAVVIQQFCETGWMVILFILYNIQSICWTKIILIINFLWFNTTDNTNNFIT